MSDDTPTTLQLATASTVLAFNATYVGSSYTLQWAPRVNGGPVGVTNPIPTKQGETTLVALDVSTVTTGGTAVTALSAGHATAGGFIFNPIGASVALVINQITTASGTVTSGSNIAIQPGQSYSILPSSGAVSVISSDSSHAFGGYGQQ